MVVTEGGSGGHCVTVFSPSGERLRSFGTFSSDDDTILNPVGVAVDSKGNVLVADRVSTITFRSSHHKAISSPK